MIELRIALEGIEKIPDLSEGKINELVRQIAGKIRNRVITESPVGEHLGGRLKRSWTQLSKHEGGLSFKSTAPYAHVIHRGSKPGSPPWPSPGPRTTLQKGRIYSSQLPGGFLQELELKRMAGVEFRKVMKTNE